MMESAFFVGQRDLRTKAITFRAQIDAIRLSSKAQIVFNDGGHERALGPDQRWVKALPRCCLRAKIS